MRHKRKRKPADRLRAEIRAGLAAQLAAILAADTTLPNGEPGTVLDDIAIRSLLGYGFSLSLHVRHPEEPSRATEDPDLSQHVPTPSPILTP